MEFNHKRPLSDFQFGIGLLELHGFEPIGVTQIYFEDTFIFNTQKEAEQAYQKLEVELQRVSGFWYGKEDFLKEVESYESEYEGKVLIYWL